ncbi:MAG: sigma-54 dependent transcriptional regulator [Anaerohalosphaeraceae bacterium]
MNIESILVVSRQPEIQHLARQFTQRLFAADDLNDLSDLLNRSEPEVIILGSDMSIAQIAVMMSMLQNKNINPPVLVIGDASCESRAADYLSLGITDYMDRLEGAEQLEVILHRTQETCVSEPRDLDFFTEDCPSAISIVGRSPAITKTLKMIRLVAGSACNPVLIIGETGTGKELAARAVHVLRHGNNQKFVAINCAALTANLLESELFGHVKGSFTGADREKTGLLELASEGTIFLDEVSEMPLDLQAKLLRVIQEKTFRKVGGIQDLECRATIVTTSNRNLIQEVRQGKFRQDLYYRLAVCPITITPLRAESRREDILLLAQYFIQQSAICPQKKGKIKGLTKLAAEMLLKHPWPGNVRELRNVIERAILLESGERIGTHNLFFEPESFEIEEMTIQDCQPSPFRDFSLEKAEKELVRRALEEAGWQKTRAASLLGITRATLYAKVKQYNLEQPGEKVTQTIS